MRKRIIGIGAVVIMNVVIVSDIVIMFTESGLSKKLDYGAGAYYYTDIPGFEQMFYTASYVSGNENIYLWILFVLWGVLMIGLFNLINKKS